MFHSGKLLFQCVLTSNVSALKYRHIGLVVDFLDSPSLIHYICSSTISGPVLYRLFTISGLVLTLCALPTEFSSWTCVKSSLVIKIKTKS